NGTQTYVEKTFDEKFHYYNKNTEQWEPFTPAGYETSAQKIQRMKNIAAATGVFGEKYEALLQTIFYLLASLATGGPIGRIVFDVAYQIVSQFIQSRLRGEPFRVDYLDLMLDTIPIGYSTPKGIFLNIARDAIKMFFDLKNKEGLTQQTSVNYIAQDTINSMVAVIINRYRARLFGSGLNVPEQEVKDAVTKLITLLTVVFNIGAYEEKISGQ
ncbi:MAG: hypothetical protein JNK66_12580, partial [Chitinophagales bacterium]|nr:hypothetical protein [Chitinophagales bacterium]